MDGFQTQKHLVKQELLFDLIGRICTFSFLFPLCSKKLHIFRASEKFHSDIKGAMKRGLRQGYRSLAEIITGRNCMQFSPTVIEDWKLMLFWKLPKGINSYILFCFIYFLFMWEGPGHKCCGEFVELGGQSVSVGSLVPPCKSRDWTHVLGLGGKYLYPWGHPKKPRNNSILLYVFVS